MQIPFTVDQLIISIFLGLLFFAAAQDVSEFKISNRYPLLVAALFPAHVWAQGFPHGWWLALPWAAGILVVGFVLFALRVFGGGDAKLIAAVSLWAAPTYLVDFLLVMTLAGGALALLFLMPKVRYGLAGLLMKLGQADLSENMQSRALPYGVAIAVAGFVLGAQLMGGM